MAEASFQRPHRTLTMRAVSRTGAWLRSRGVERPLSTERILASARRRTGCSDFGDDFFREPLDMLVESLEKDARLTSFGRLLARQNLVHFACNRLRMQRALDAHPAALDVPVTRPLFVLGLPRTGTTLLQELLSCDPARRPLLCWESLFPAPLSRFGRLEIRRHVMRLIIHVLDDLAPALRNVHPLRADSPEECTWLTANTFVSSAFSLMGRVERYEAWIDAAGEPLQDRAYRDFARQLQLLQHGAPPRPWILKSPVHLRALSSLLRVFPDAGVVQTHRDPEKVVPSTCSLFAIMRSIFSDDVDPRTLGPEILGKLAAARERSEPARVIAGSRLIDVSFGDLVQDPIGTVRRITEHFDGAGSSGAGTDARPGGSGGSAGTGSLDAATERRMRDWLARHPAPTAHAYSLSQFGLIPGDVRSALGSGPPSGSIP